MRHVLNNGDDPRVWEFNVRCYTVHFVRYNSNSIIIVFTLTYLFWFAQLRRILILPEKVRMHALQCNANCCRVDGVAVVVAVAAYDDEDDVPSQSTNQ